MLTTYCVENGHIAVRENTRDPDLLRRAVWIDMLQPSLEEEHAVQNALMNPDARGDAGDRKLLAPLSGRRDPRSHRQFPLRRRYQAEFSSTPISFVLSGNSLIYGALCHAQGHPGLRRALPEITLLPGQRRRR